MDPLWHDSVGSFLDSSAIGAGSDFSSFSGANIDTPWFGSATDGMLPSQSLLWWQHGTSDSAPASTGSTPLSGWIPHGALVPGPDTNTLPNWASTEPGGPSGGSSTVDGGLLWTDPSNNLLGALSAHVGQPTTGILGSISGADFGSGNGASQWQQFVAGFLPSGSEPWFKDISALVWTPSGITGQPPLTGNSPHTGDLPGSMAPQQLVWTDPSPGVPPLLDGQPLTGVVPPNLFSRS